MLPTCFTGFQTPRELGPEIIFASWHTVEKSSKTAIKVTASQIFLKIQKYLRAIFCSFEDGQRAMITELFSCC